jgi:hypothetical protein
MAALNWFCPDGETVFTLSRGHREIDCTYWTLRRYAKYGSRDVNGETVLLQVCKLPGGIGTTLEAYRRFISRLSGVLT